MQPIFLANPIIKAYSQSDLLGKLIFLFLFALSVLTWSLFLKKYLEHRSIKKNSTYIEALFQKNRLNPLCLPITKLPPSPYTSLYNALKTGALEVFNKNRTQSQEETVYLSKSDVDWLSSHLECTTAALIKKLEKNLFLLSTTVSLAPFLGLLGTVWGILLTFAELQKGASVNANSTIMGGLAMALGTTVLGLIVAIPALISYNYLKASLSHLTLDFENFSQEILSSVEFQYRRIE